MLEDLFIFELANNHQGDVNHGLKIIQQMGEIKNKYNLKAAVKFQFRDFSTFIHPRALENTENDKIQRFVSTKLDWSDFERMIQEVRKYNMLTMCTPFDESSVEYINKMDIDIIKVGSPSLHDWPLLEKIKTSTSKPIIISSGGCDFDHIDKLVHFFKNKYIGLMHCVSIYPTPNDKLNLRTIDTLCKKYPHITVGFSTHESPTNYDAIKIAYAIGARMFEKHVGLDILNAYSASPEQVGLWVQSYLTAVEMTGTDKVYEENETKDLEKLYRGVFFKRDVAEGDVVTADDVYFAFPKTPNCIHSGEFHDFIADKTFAKDDPVSVITKTLKNEKAQDYVNRVNEFMSLNNVHAPENITLSHHYGIQRIHETGCVMFTVVDEELYSKKILVLLAGQSHPEHYHKIKTETFVVIAGSMELVVNDQTYTLKKNDTCTVKPYEKHYFKTNEGVIFEEIATSIPKVVDSFYTDLVIQEKSDHERKTMFTTV
jgi:N-acetylneuraminate synthase